MRDAVRQSGGRSRSISQAQADETFLRALSKIRQRFQEKSINTREMLQVFEEELPPSLWFEGKQSLDWFYQGWVNGTALPRFELQAVEYTPKPRRAGVDRAIGAEHAAQDIFSPASP